MARNIARAAAGENTVHHVDQAKYFGRDASFFRQFPQGCVNCLFAPFQLATGNRPIPLPRRRAATDQEDVAIVVKTDDTNRRDGDRLGFQGHGFVLAWKPCVDDMP
jgi:hypothetical protein